MAKVKFGVELIRQEQNPICWVASCAMVKGYGTKTSVGVGDFTGGFDPSNSSIPNPASDWAGCTDAMTQWGFDVQAVSGTMTGDGLVSLLQNNGPMVLLHMCTGFPYGSQWGTQNFKATDAHAVVVTGVDTDAGKATFNNPWGDRDQSCSLATLLQHINSDKSMGKTLGFWQSSDSSSNQSIDNSSSSQSPGDMPSQNADDASSENTDASFRQNTDDSQSTDTSSSQNTDESSSSGSSRDDETSNQ